MIALVISIIVMLILAGVSISAIVGEDGVLTKAKAASIASRKASILEELNMELASYNIDAVLKTPEQTTTMLGNLIDKELIDTVLSSSEEYVAEATSPMGIPQFDDTNNYTGYIDYAVKKEDYSIIISIDDSGIYKAEYGDVTISAGGSVAGGTTLVTDKAFESSEGVTAEEQGKFVIDNDASVMFVDEISGELSIQVKSGTHAKVYAFKDMTLTNSGIKRSAIDIEPGGTLDLYVAEDATVTVNSGLGEDASGNIPGKGGYAGVHVPEGTILNLYGEGTIISSGGKAGKGGTVFSGSESAENSGSGGGGAGAGIGGNGGRGGEYQEGLGSDGGNGEDCGNINISNTLTVYAYGGAGGAGGAGSSITQTAGGAGGYPGAGIGGGGAGGAGGTCCAGAGGYTGGSGDSDDRQAHNGLYGYEGYNGNDSTKEGGGGYFAGAVGTSTNGINRAQSCLGGIRNQGSNVSLGDQSGDGGTAGKGGMIKVSQNCKVYAFNGNLYTDGTEYEKGVNQCPIYLQNGLVTTKYDYVSGYARETFKLKERTVNGIDSRALEYQNLMYITNESYASKKFISKNSVLNNVDMSKQGIGSGAGYIEVSNGTYTVDPSMN